MTPNRDPTGTSGLRRSHAANLRRRWRLAAQLVRQGLVDQGMFGLSGVSAASVQTAAVSGTQVRAFQSWFDMLLSQAVLGSSQGQWAAQYVAAAYDRGAKRAVRADDAWSEEDHPRHPEGSSKGGEFAPKGGATSEPSDEVKRIVKKATKGHGLTSAHLSDDERRDLEQWLQDQPKSDKEVYRGIWLKSDSDLDAWTEGTDKDFRSLQSFTEDPIRSSAYGTGGKHFIRINMPPGETVDISKLSTYPQEQEHVLVEGGKFRITKRTRHSPGFYNVDVVRDRESKDSLPIGSVDLLVAQHVSELQGIMEAVSQQAVRIFSQAILKRRSNPRRVSAMIGSAIKKVGVARSLLASHAAVVGAYTTGTLDALASAGIRRVAVVPEWHAPKRTHDAARRRAQPRGRAGRFRRAVSALLPRQQVARERRERRLAALLEEVNVLTAGDDRVCPTCEDIAEQGPYSIDEARGLIPAHPRCRCAFEAA